MICDDDHEILELTGLLLESYGYRTLLEPNSSKVFNRVLTEKPDILLLDFWMPRITGDEIIRSLKNDIRTKQLPVIMFSASREGLKTAQECGANDFIAKPYDADQLNTKIRSLLRSA